MSPVRELLPGVWTWPRFSERHGYDFNGTLVLHDAGNLCIDPVEPDAATLDRLAEVGVARVLITNRNHVRAANAVRERTGARVAIHPADAAYARAQGAQLDAELAVGERIGPFSVVGVPGKSPGEVALHDPARRILVVGDAVIGNPPSRLSLLPERVIDDPPALRASVRRLLELDFDAIVVGDGVPIPAGARERLRELVAGFAPDGNE
jgi:glyoxylase-like metal-dependent hydrolase (beta-lactamase superfamily II)